MAVAASFHVEKVEDAVRTFAHDVRAGGVKVSYALQEPVRGRNVAVSAKWNYSGLRGAMAEFESVKSSKRSNYAPIKQGVLELRENSLAENLRVTEEFAARYAALTGHTILGVAVHHDEGHIEDGREVIHYHAHIVFDRRDLADPAKKIIDTNANDMRKIQTLAADVTGLPRGKPARETKRVHLSVGEWRRMKQDAAEKTADVKRDVAEQHAKELANAKREVESAKREALQATQEVIAAKNETAKVVRELATEKEATKKAKASNLKLTAEFAEAKAEYSKAREAMKASGAATQRDYQELKKKFEAASETKEAAQAAVAEFTATIEEWKKIAERRKAERDAAQREAKALNATANNLRAELTGSTMRVSELEAELEETKVELSAAVDGYLRVSKERDELNQELVDVYGVVNEFSREAGVDVAAVVKEVDSARQGPNGERRSVSWRTIILALVDAVRDLWRGRGPDNGPDFERE